MHVRGIGSALLQKFDVEANEKGRKFTRSTPWKLYSMFKRAIILWIYINKDIIAIGIRLYETFEAVPLIYLWFFLYV